MGDVLWRVLVCSLLFGTVVGAAQPQPAASALPGFDAATIRAADRREPLDIEFFPGRFVATNVTLELLIEQAYEIEDRDLVGGPDWIRNGDRFDVEGRTAVGTGNAEVLRMLRVLLGDRFGLLVTEETQQKEAYTLVAGDNHGLHPPLVPDDRPRIATTHNGKGAGASFIIEGRNATVKMLADELAADLNVLVTDHSGLGASYDYKITCAGAPAFASDLQRDLGLQAESGQGSADVYVVRNVARPKLDK
jgi:uncharacterized protein (TIGR03435 family)